MVFDSAPASNSSQRADWFSGVKQMIPAFVTSSTLVSSGSHRFPLSMSAFDIKGFGSLDYQWNPVAQRLCDVLAAVPGPRYENIEGRIGGVSHFELLLKPYPLGYISFPLDFVSVPHSSILLHVQDRSGSERAGGSAQRRTVSMRPRANPSN